MEPVTPTIISPPVDCESFTTPDGTTYTRTDTLALGRARLLQRFQTELQFGTSIPALQKLVMETYAAYNSRRDVDGAQLLGSLKDRLDLLGQNRMREAEIVALFYNAPDEDPTSYDHAAITQKVNVAWRAIDADFFTHAAFKLLLRTATHYPSLENLATPEPSAPGLPTA
ncbi:hypothetical protein [Hymenobacter properus]|uniref:Uncharacterized protein n=1 Tax=Hymenobacter properus TaxID=2791026 RepID=A0A931FHA3_9BACT|nr:hypothetical protein [Hymenobacter properus]MBF9140847.1 hypothetical protein [Hymenobacter properus]MBR7719656.1 hypothetical protein [Microvirga sp. SRT04]